MTQLAKHKGGTARQRANTIQIIVARPHTPTGLHRLLIVEDAPDDVKMIIAALSPVVSKEHIAIATSGEEALDYLFGRGAHGGRNTDFQPDLITLDLNLPRLSGFEVLRQIRSNPATRLLPVIIVSASAEQRDIRLASALGANSYVRKPLDYVRLSETLAQMARYWLELNIAPPIGHALDK